MKKLLAAIVVLATFSSAVSNSHEFAVRPKRDASNCEPKKLSCSMGSPVWNYVNRKLLTCGIGKQSIDKPGTLIDAAANNAVEAFDIQNNKMAKFLPDKLAEKFPNLIYVQSYEASIGAIGADNFKNLKKLVVLIMPYNKISIIEEGAFRDLVSLEKLLLTDNKLQFLNSNLFETLTKLKELDLRKNQIQALSSKLFDNLTSLGDLKLDSNNIQHLHEEIFAKLVEIRNISLYKNELEEVSVGLFKNNLKLERVRLEENKLKRISATTFDGLSNLKYVDLEKNDCVNAYFSSKSFEAMKETLKEKCLTFAEQVVGGEQNYQKKLEDFKNDLRLEMEGKRNASNAEHTATITNMSNQIKFLLNKLGGSASDNQTCKTQNALCILAELDWNFNKQKLLTCSIKYQAIDSFAFKIASTDDSVRAFQITTNPSVKHIPGSISDVFPRTVAISIFGCSLETIERRNFASLVQLAYLNLPRNNIETIESGSFEDLINLEQLILSMNNIQFIGANTFKSLKKLKILRVDRNKIQHVVVGAFEQLGKLEELDLSSNMIEFFYENIFANLTNLKVVRLSRNSLVHVYQNLFIGNLQLEEVRLNENYISSIGLSTFQSLAKMRIVDLSGNVCLDKLYEADKKKELAKDISERCVINDY